MEDQNLRRNAVRLLLALAIVLPTAALAACGSDSNSRTQLRPPVTRNISVVIGQDTISASPDTFGAGPLNLLVSNQSGASRTLKIDGARLAKSVGPIQPEDTATLKVTVQPGALQLAAADTQGVKPVRILVGPERASGQGQLQLP